ncbi:MAG: SLC13 family permease, partial [Candidatus Cloacimonadaceae bacterium]
MTIEIMIVLAILLFTVIMLVFEVLRIDLIAILCILSLGWTGILTPTEALSGFSSNAVIAMMAVMIMGNGISRTGIMNKFSSYIIHLAGKSRQKLIGIVSASVGLLSAFLQNVGATALFLPAVLNISKREKIPASELIMPLGFAAILGGTLTMVASGPLLLINDILRDAKLDPYGLFAVTPVGLVLLFAGILYFVLLGRWVLPHSEAKDVKESEQKKIIDTWHLPYTIYHYTIPSGSKLIDETPESSGLWSHYNLNILAVSDEENIQYAPWRKTRFKDTQELVLLGDSTVIEKFAADFGLQFREKLDEFSDLNDPTSAGFVELIIPPQSLMVGKTIREIAFRYNFAVEPVILFSRDRQIKGDFSDHKIKSGDMLIVHGLWENMLRLKNSKDFIVITSFESEKKEEVGKAWIAGLCFLGAIGLTLFGFP